MEKIMESPLPQVIVAQLAARRHYAVPKIFHHAGMLAHFYTDFFLSSAARKLLDQKYFFALQPSALKRMRGRFTPELSARQVTCFPLFGLALAVKHLLAGNDMQKLHQVQLWAGDNFASKVIRKGFRQANVIYTILGEGLGITTHPTAAELYKVTDVMICPCWYSLILEEHQQWPGWEDGFHADSFRKMAQMDLQRMAIHWDHSDLIICPSDFVREGVIKYGGPSERCVVVPFGFDSEQYFSPNKLTSSADQSIKIIFVGGVMLRKGVQYLQEALNLLKSNKISVKAVGSMSISDKAAGILRQNLDLVGRVARSEVSAFYQQADIFVFPSIAEGSANVCYEAMAAGLPVITTPNAGSVVRDGIDGFIVPIRDSETLAEKIDLLARDRDLRQWMSENARKRAQEFTLKKYGERLIETIVTHFS